MNGTVDSVSRRPAVDVSIVVPVYGGARMLRELATRVHRVMEDAGVAYEMVFVNDCSPDDSWEVLLSLRQGAEDRIVLIDLMRNVGQHNALMCGFRNVAGEYVVTMDDDLQNPPEEIPKLMRAIRETGDDLVYGDCTTRMQARWRNAGSAVIRFFFKRVFNTCVQTSSFRIVRRRLVDSITSYDLNFTFVDGLFAWNTQRISEVAVDHHPRTSGQSGYSLAKLLTLALNLFTNFSLLPLQLASAVGLLASVVGLVTGGYYLLQALLSNIAVPGYASLIVAVMTLGGLQLLALGIIGEYIGRLHLNVNRKPQYTVREVVGKECEAQGGPHEPDERRQEVTAKSNCEAEPSSGEKTPVVMGSRQR